jgi:hypothetical protein
MQFLQVLHREKKDWDSRKKVAAISMCVCMEGEREGERGRHPKTVFSLLSILFPVLGILFPWFSTGGPACVLFGK